MRDVLIHDYIGVDLEEVWNVASPRTGQMVGYNSMWNWVRRKDMPRYWISYDLGLQADYEQLYEWLDRHEANECGDNMATIVSDQSRERIAKQVKSLLSKQNNARVYIISRDTGGKF